MVYNHSNYQLKVNESLFDFTENEINDIDLIATGSNTFNLITQHRSINASVTVVDNNSKSLTVIIEGEIYHVIIKDSLDQMLDKMGFGSVATKQIKEVKAPMPGLVLEIAVTMKQQLQPGDKLIILEAMKMENSLQATTEAVVKQVHVKKGQSVVKGQLLITFE